MLKVDFFSTRWENLNQLDSLVCNAKSTQTLQILKNVIEKKINNQPIREYNPILIKAPIASGKTHILEGIAHEIHNKRPDFSIAFGKAGGLLNIFDNKKSHSRRIHELQSCDIFLIDDIHFLANEENVQYELTNLIDLLIEQGSLVITTYSTASPQLSLSAKGFSAGKSILDDALLSRITSGLNFSIDSPDLDVRMRIVEQQCEVLKFNLGKSLCLTIARYSQDARQLQGIVKTVWVYSQSMTEKLDESMILRLLEEFESKNAVTTDLIIAQTASFYGLTTRELKSRSRKKNILLGRQMGIYLCRKLLGLPYLNIAELFGGKDHTTIIHACKKIENDENLLPTINMLTQRILHISQTISNNY